MSDNNQQIIEALENLQTKFKDHGRYVSAELIQEEIDNLKPKPQYIEGKAYIIKDSRYGRDISAIYRGDDKWLTISPFTGNVMDSARLEEGDEVFEVAKTVPPQTVTTVEELEALPANTILRSHSTYETKDVAIKGTNGRWFQDNYERSRAPQNLLASKGTWDVVSLG